MQAIDDSLDKIARYVMTRHREIKQYKFEIVVENVTVNSITSLNIVIVKRIFQLNIMVADGS